MPDSVTPDPAAPVFLAPTTTTLDPGKKRAAAVQLVVTVVLVVVLLAFVLPGIVDYEQVGAALGTLAVWQFLLLLVVGCIVFVPEGWLFALVAPPLRLRNGVLSWVASTGVGNTLPAVNLVVRYGMCRSWGVTAESTMIGIFMSGVIDNIVKFSLPALAVFGLLLIGVGGFPSVIIWMAVIALVIVVVTCAVSIGVIRSDRFAVGLGDALQRSANWALAKMKRPPKSGLSARILATRDAAVATIRSRFLRSTAASAMGKLMTYVVLLLSLRLADIPADVIGPGEAFMVWTLVLLVQAVPLTPGGVGFVEAAMLALFTAIAGEEYANAVAVSIVLYRATTWVLPILLGWPIVWWWRREVGRGRLPDPFLPHGADGGPA